MKKNKKNKKKSSPILLFYIFIAILIAGIIFKIYKALNTGIIYDEAFTFSHFTTSFHAALNSYLNPNNNHVLNSIAICVANKFFSSYEQFPRIPSLIFGIIYSISAAYIVYNIIKSNTLKIILLLLITLNWFVFDLSFLARGYSIALAAIYSAIAIIIAILNKKIKHKKAWLPIIILSAMNFLALGSMLSCIPVLFSINFVFILFYSHRVFNPPAKILKTVIINTTSIFLLTTTATYLLYMRIYKQILSARNDFGLTSFTTHIKQVLVNSMTKQNLPQNLIIYIAFIAIVLISLIFALYKFKKSNPKKYLNLNNPTTFILILTITAVATIFIYRVIFKMSLGFMRNSVFLVPLFLLTCSILCDKLWLALKNKTPIIRLTKTAIIITCALLILQTLPSAYAVQVHDWDRQSMAGPLLRRLKEINPHKIWRIRLTEKTKYLNLPLRYYKNFNHRLQLAYRGDCDIIITHKSQTPKNANLLDENHFKKYNCCIIINPKIYNKKKPKINKKEPLLAEIEHFIECIEKNKKPLVSGDDGLKALKYARALL